MRQKYLNASLLVFLAYFKDVTSVLYIYCLETEFPFLKQIMQEIFRRKAAWFCFLEVWKLRKTPKKREINTFFTKNQKNLKKGVDIKV